MDLTIYDVIKGLVVTGKSVYLNQKLKKLVIWVHIDANKSQVKKAVERLFNVKIAKINVIRCEGKLISFKRIQTKKADAKKVIITLKEGYSIDALDQSQMTVSAEDALPVEKASSAQKD